MAAAHIHDRQPPVAQPMAQPNPPIEVDTSVVGTTVLERVAHLEQRDGIDRSINPCWNNYTANSAHI
jgi:hypothetical protein